MTYEFSTPQPNNKTGGGGFHFPPKMKSAATNGPPQPLHSRRPLRRRYINRLFAAVYASAILTLLYHHILTLIRSTSAPSLFISLSLLIADAVLAYMWSATQAFRMNPVHRQVFPELLEQVLDRRDFPAVDVFICTADPYKEPPIDVVNTALSVMAYDYPAEKLSVYVSDDGGSELTMFAFMEAAEFGKIWLPFCKKNDVMDRCPHAYFSSKHALTAEALEIKKMYESMKTRVEEVIERGKIMDEYISCDEQRRIFSQYWDKDFSRQNHPSIIQVLLNSKMDVDNSSEEAMPNLIYVSREKSKTSPHHFKAGALNTLLRVSGSMTNSPIILTLDCDMYSNDPLTARKMLCYLARKPEPNEPNYAYVQFPQRYHRLNKADIYASEHKRLYIIDPIGLDGLDGPYYVGSGCFFRRRAFFGGPSSYIDPEIPELNPNHVADKAINGKETLGLAHHVAKCNFERETIWGTKLGFRYGSLSEDYHTGYWLHYEGWKAVFCNPSRAAFLGDVPITLNDVLNQMKRWSVGLLEVGFSKYSPLTFGISNLGFFMGQGYARYSFWPTWAVPITIYAFLPSLAMLQGFQIFPKVPEPLFFVYAFLFLGSYGQDCLDFISAQGTLQRWWSDQRMWLIRGMSSLLFGIVEYTSKCLGMETRGFNVTNKVMDEEQSKRYDKGIFEFGVASPMFVPLAMAAILNLIALFSGFVHALKGMNNLDSFFIQIFISGFAVLNSLPFYEAMFVRRDNGRITAKTTVTSVFFVGVLYGIASVIFTI